MIILIRFYTLSLIPLFSIFTMNPLYDYNTYDFFSSKFLIYILLSMNAFLFIFSGMLFLWLYQSNKFMVISYNNAKTIQVNTIAHKIVPACLCCCCNLLRYLDVARGKAPYSFNKVIRVYQVMFQGNTFSFTFIVALKLLNQHQTSS